MTTTQQRIEVRVRHVLQDMYPQATKRGDLTEIILLLDTAMEDLARHKLGHYGGQGKEFPALISDAWPPRGAELIELHRRRNLLAHPETFRDEQVIHLAHDYVKAIVSLWPMLFSSHSAPPRVKGPVIVARSPAPPRQSGAASAHATSSHTRGPHTTSSAASAHATSGATSAHATGSYTIRGGASTSRSSAASHPSRPHSSRLMAGALAFTGLTAVLAGLALGLARTSFTLAALTGAAVLLCAGLALYLLWRWTSVDGVLLVAALFIVVIVGWWLLTTRMLDGYAFTALGRDLAAAVVEWLAP